MPKVNWSTKKQVKQSGKNNDVYAPESNKVVRQYEINNIEEWEKQILYYRSHLDVFIQEYFSTPDKPIKLFPFQEVIIRNYGNCSFIDDVESRSLGKTWKAALALSALAILYPDTRILVVSKTVRQAMLTIKYIEFLANDNPNLKREIIFPIKIAKDGALVRYKSGAEVEAIAMNADGSNLRGLRKKVIYIDESAWVKSDVIQSVLMPILQYKRDIYWKYKDQGFEDVESKLIQTTSAYLKSCDFFTRFKNNLIDIKNGDTSKFSCAINYKTGVRYGIIDENFVESQKKTMPLSSWEMEWNTKFIGSTDGSYFPYDLTEPCRTFEHVEICQPKGSKSRYIATLDVATSSSQYADNACLCVIKISEKGDGTFYKYLVNIKTFHGYKLEALANEVRKTCVRFPNIEKIIIDANAIGEGVVSLLNCPFVDEDNKEYPPFVCDDLEFKAGNALPIIRAFKASNADNGRMATATRLYLENKSLFLPVPSVNVRREVEQYDSDKKRKKESEEFIENKMMLLEEMAIYIDADALQFEMGTIVPKITASGNVTYDTSSPSMHKDRYSSLASGLLYIFELEEINKENTRGNGDFCIGAAFSF